MAIDWLGELRALRGLVSYEGVCTADGAAGGGTLVCSDLTLRPDYDGNLVVITSGAFIGQARDIDGATNLGTVTPHTAFGGQIVAGVEFLIVAIRTTPAEVAALTALVILLTADVADVETKLDLPAADSALAATIAQVVGNKESTAVYAKDNVSDVIRYLKGILDANITASGVADAGSGVGLIRDAARTEANDWWNGQTVLMLTGAAAGQKRPITDFLAATDDIIVAPDFDAAPGAGDVYVILAHYNAIVPRAADSALNALTSQVVGRKDDTLILSPDNVSSLIRYVKGILTAIGLAADAGDLGTLFGRNKKVVEAVHVHVLLVVGDTTAMDPALDTALQDFLEDKGYDVVVADPVDVAANLELHYDVIIVSASCDAGDVGNLANLQTALAPVICHSALIAVSAVFNLGGTAGTEAAATDIEIRDNTTQWLLEQAIGDLAVTAATTIYKMETKTTNAITLAETDTGSGNDHITMVRLGQGQEDGGTPAYAPDFDRYFIGVADFTNINAAFTTLMEELYDHVLHESRFSPSVVVTPKRVYQEVIPDTDFSLAAIDTTLVSDPPAADAANSIVDIDQKQNRTFVLRSLWVNITSWGTGAEMTFQLWVLINGVVTSVDSVVVNALGVQNLMDIFGLPEVHADGIWITVITDVGNTGACSGTFKYAEAKK